MRKKLLLLMTTVLMVCFMCLPVLAASVTKGGTKVATVTPNNTKTTYQFSYNQGDALGDNQYGVVIPIKITSSGYFEVAAALNTSYLDGSMDIKLYKDVACTTATSDLLKLFMYDNTISDTDSTYLAAGTYYLRISTSRYSYEMSPFNYSGSFTTRFVSNANRSLANNKKTLISYKDGGTYLKISVPKTGYVTVTGTEGSYVALYNSSKKLLNTGYVSLVKGNAYKATFAVKKGTYYLRSKTDKDVYTISYKFSTDQGFKSGKTATFYPADKKQYIYVKYKPGKTGRFTLTNVGQEAAYITLCNSKKKAISEEVYTSSYKYSKKVVFAIKKNVTYYIKLRPSYGGKLSYKAAFLTINEKSGKNTSKAVSIKKGKTAKGLILPGESKKDYYKMTVSKAQVVNVKIGGSVYSGKIKVSIYSDKKLKKKIGTVTVAYGDYSGKFNIYTSGSKKLRKGTYYIVVTRDGSKTDGFYYVSWLK